MRLDAGPSVGKWRGTAHAVGTIDPARRLTLDNPPFRELDPDQQREGINTRQRFEAFLEAHRRAEGYRGSMVFSATNGTDYLLRSCYDAGRRRQTSLGRRSAETEQMKRDFDSGRAQARERLASARAALERQAAINRALGLGRMPRLAARIVRAIDAGGLPGSGLRIVGTHALYAYEAAAGVAFAPDITTTDDLDLLFDARAALRFAVDPDIGEQTLLALLRKADSTFEKGERAFQARNADGFVVDLIKPMRNPPWRGEAAGVSADRADLEAGEIEGLVWQENAPAFSAIVVDAAGQPVRVVAPDPRAFVVHKLWLSERADREPIRRRRDAAQARAVGKLTSLYFAHLPFEPEAMRFFPRGVVEAAASLFETPLHGGFTW